MEKQSRKERRKEFMGIQAEALINWVVAVAVCEALARVVYKVLGTNQWNYRTTEVVCYILCIYLVLWGKEFKYIYNPQTVLKKIVNWCINLLIHLAYYYFFLHLLTVSLFRNNLMIPSEFEVNMGQAYFQIIFGLYVLCVAAYAVVLYLKRLSDVEVEIKEK